MSYSQNLINRTAQSWSRQGGYCRVRKDIPSSLNTKNACRVDNRSLNLLLQIAEQTAMRFLVETQVQGDVTQLLDNDERISIWKDQLHSTWVVSELMICGVERSLELFDGNGLLLGKLFSDYDNKACWAELLDALPLYGES